MKFLSKTLFVLSFLPSVTFGLVPSEIFPWGLFTLGFRRFLSLRLIFVVGSFFIVSLFSIIVFQSFNFSEYVRSFLAYLNGPLVASFVLFLTRLKNVDLDRIVQRIFYSMILLGIVQYSGVLHFLDYVFKFFIPRGSMTALSFIDRGVTIFSSEPSRAGLHLVLVYSFLRYFVFKRFRLLFDFFVLGYLLVFVQSFASLGFFVLCFVVFNFSLIGFLGAGCVGLLIFFFGVEHMGGFGRAGKLLLEFWSSGNFSEFIGLFIKASGFRLVSVWSAYSYFLTDFLGGGLGNWEVSSVKALSGLDYDVSKIPFFSRLGGIVAVRPTSYFSSLVLDFGFYGICFMFVFLALCFRNMFFGKVSSRVLIVYLFSLVFWGAVGDTVVWALLAMISQKRPSSGKISDYENVVVKNG